MHPPLQGARRIVQGPRAAPEGDGFQQPVPQQAVGGLRQARLHLLAHAAHHSCRCCITVAATVAASQLLLLLLHHSSLLHHS